MIRYAIVFSLCLLWSTVWGQTTETWLETLGKYKKSYQESIIDAGFLDQLLDLEKQGKQLFSSIDTNQLQVQYLIGQVQGDLQDYPTAAITLNKVLKDYQSLLGTEHISRVEVLISLSSIYLALEDMDKAEQCLNDAKQILSNLNLSNSLFYSDILEQEGTFHMDLGEFDKAEQLYQEALALKRKEKHPNSKHLRTILFNYAILCYYKGAYQQSKTLLEEVQTTVNLEIAGSYYDAEWQTKVANVLGVVYSDLGELDKAEMLYLESIDLAKQLIGMDNLTYTSSLNNLAALYYEMGRYQEAIDLFLETSEIEKGLYGESHSRYMGSLNNLASVYQTVGEHRKAIETFQKVLELSEKQSNQKTILYASILHNLGYCYTEEENYSTAEGFLKEAVKQRKQLLGTQHSSYLISLKHLAKVYGKTKREQEAEDLYTQILATRKQNTGKTHPNYIIDLNSFARYYLSVEKDSLALIMLSKALTLNTNYEGDLTKKSKHWESFLNQLPSLDPIDYTSLLRSLELLVEYRNGKEDKLKIYLVAKTLIALDRKQAIWLRNAKDQALIAERMERYTELALEQICHLKEQEKAEYWIEEGLKLVEQNKYMLLSFSMENVQAKRFGDLPDSLAEKEVYLQHQITQKKAELAYTKSKETKQTIRIELNKLNIEFSNFRDFIEETYPKYSNLKYNQYSPSISQLQTQLATDQVILEYFVGKNESYVFVIDQSHVNLLKLGINRSALKKQLNDFRKHFNYDYVANLEKPLADFSKEAHALYKILLRPVEADIANHKTLLIIPDKELGYLSFDALVQRPLPMKRINFGQLAYLIKDYNLSYAYSSRLLLNKEVSKPKGKANFLAFGASYPSIDWDSLGVKRPKDIMKLRDHLQPIIGTEEELKQLSQLIDGEFRLGDQATEKAFKTLAPQAQCVHLAMHGISNLRKPIFSSLAFTENGDSLEDNFLQAWEISQLDLPLDLLVLSACETGYGKMQKGDGINSLARAFAYAGTKSVVFSLWEVNDRATALIMEDFYKNLIDGNAKSLALRQAKLKYLEHRNDISGHPLFWAAFVQLGNDKAIQLPNRKSDSYWFWLLWSGLGIVVFVGYLRYRKIK